MAELKATKEELIAIYPRPTDCIDVVTTVNIQTQLDIRYLQRGADDPYRNWESYRQWQRENDTYAKAQTGSAGLQMPLPSDFDMIYHGNMRFIESGLIDSGDRILLATDLAHGDDRIPYSGVTAYLSFIRRHQDPALKGLGREFYQNLSVWLKKRGYRFVTTIPVPTKVCMLFYSLGWVSVSSLKPDKASMIVNPDLILQTIVHFLYDDDRQTFENL